ncbi:MAG: T9SS type A sorting domain-containing protein [Bacteroidota bacterium]
MCLVFISSLAQAFGQSANFTFESSGPGEIIATHDEWENDNLVYSNGFQAIWGTTIDFFPKHTVYLQSFVPSLGGGYGQVWDGMYYSPNYAPFLTFHGLEEDGNQLVVAASQEFDSQITSFPYVFSVDIFSGAVLWSTPLLTGDGVSVSDMQIIQDFNGDFVIGISFQTIAPNLNNPNDWSGLAILKLDPAGNILFFETVREQSNLPELFRLTDLIQSTISGNYVMSGAYSGNGPQEEAFLVEWDQGSGTALGAPLNLYDFNPGAPEQHLSLTDDGGQYYLSHYAFNQVIGLGIIDPFFNPVTALVFPPFAGKNNVYSDDINYDPASGSIELMLTMQDFAGVFSTGLGQIPPGLGSISAREFDYAPGFKEGFPVAYTALQPSFVPAASYLFLAHPTFGAGTILPFPSDDNYLRVLDSSPSSCIPVNGFFETPFSFPFGQSVQALVPDNLFAPIPDVPIQDSYDGVVYDCGLSPIGVYKKANLSPEPTISLLPNPVQNSLQLEGDLSEFKQIELYDLTGRLVKSASARAKLSVAELPAGIYHLTLLGQSRRETIKFVKE